MSTALILLALLPLYPVLFVLVAIADKSFREKATSRKIESVIYSILAVTALMYILQ